MLGSLSSKIPTLNLFPLLPVRVPEIPSLENHSFWPRNSCCLKTSALPRYSVQLGKSCCRTPTPGLTLGHKQGDPGRGHNQPTLHSHHKAHQACLKCEHITTNQAAWPYRRFSQGHSTTQPANEGSGLGRLAEKVPLDPKKLLLTGPAL